MSELLPSYLDFDFDTIKQDIIDKMKLSETFRDYRHDASNITILIELMAYLGSLNSYYLNKIAKNVFIDTADMKENVVRMAYLVGYYPKGSRSAASVPLSYIRRESTTSYALGDRMIWETGTTVWECVYEGTTAETTPSIVGKILGDVITDGTVWWKYISIGSGLTVTIPETANCKKDDTIHVNAWTAVATETSKANYNGESIYFTITKDILHTIENVNEFPIVLSVPIAQGFSRVYSYYGRDLIDETIYLPTLEFGYDDNIVDEYPSVEVVVGGELEDDDFTITGGTTWYRVANFYERTSGLENENNVYVLRLNKYGQYIIRFSNNKNVPGINDTIIVRLIETLGSNGNVGSESITIPYHKNFVTIVSPGGTEVELNASEFSVSNPSAVVGGIDSENINEIKDGIEGTVASQFRCVTKNDYIFFLENHNSVKKAIAWGERDSSPDGGNIMEYNKVYVCVYPNSWDNFIYTNIETERGGIIKKVFAYTVEFIDTMLTYLEPYKMLSAYEDFNVLPDFVYFRFNISVRIKRNYKINLVREDIKNKLSYYFESEDREFGQSISYMDITNFLLDITKTSSINKFSNVRGIDYLNIRNIDFYDTESLVWRNPFDTNDDNIYPQWSRLDKADWEENKLKGISLYFNQYPMVSINDCVFEEED